MRNMMMTVGGIGLAMVAACVGTDAPEADVADVAAPPSDEVAVEESAVLRLEIERGHSVTFLEPAPGGLYLVERMAPGQTFVLGDAEASDALAAFARLRPGQAAPAALQAAYDRARAMASEPIAAVRVRGGGQAEQAPAQSATPGVVQQSLVSSSSAATFVNTNGGCNWGPQGSFCRVNWANGFFASDTGTSGLCIVDHYAGNGVTIQITVNGTITSTFQGPGTIAQYSLGGAGANVSRRIDVTNASGDSFHVGCRWGN